MLFTPGNLEYFYELLISGSLASPWWLLDEFLTFPCVMVTLDPEVGHLLCSL